MKGKRRIWEEARRWIAPAAVKACEGRASPTRPAIKPDPSNAYQPVNLMPKVGGGSLYARSEGCIPDLMYVKMRLEGVPVSTAIATIPPQKLRRARVLLGLTQVEAGRALGQVRPETVSRWENRSSSRVRHLHAQTARCLIEIARMLQDVAPTEEDRRRFLNSPQPELRGKTPRQVLLEDPPFGARQVYDLLGRILHGIPS